MPVTFSTFERLKDKGIAAYRKGDYVAAKPYLIQAAECMIELAENARTPAMRSQHEAYARELLDLAKDCDRAAADKRPTRARAGEADESGPDAGEWIVHDKPTIGFDNIAGPMAPHSIRDHKQVICVHQPEAVFIMLPFLTYIRHPGSPEDPTHFTLSFIQSGIQLVSQSAHFEVCTATNNIVCIKYISN